MVIIDSNNVNSSGGPSGARRNTPVVPSTPKTQPTPAEATESAPQDSVVLSPEAQNFSRLQSKVSNLPDVNMDRVTAIRQAIADGRFEIDPERIAENMLKQDELFN